MTAESSYRAAERNLWRLHGAEPIEHRVHLATEGVDVRDGPPVLFVHGANTSGASWVALASRLRDFRCLIVDRPGTGLSEPLRGRLDAARVARLGDAFVSDIVATLGLPSTHVVATSLGGYVALRSAATAQAKVERMVQFSWPVGAPTSWLPWAMRVMGIPGMARLMAAMPATEASARMTFRRIGHGASLDAGRITREDIATYLAPPAPHEDAPRGRSDRARPRVAYRRAQSDTPPRRAARARCCTNPVHLG
jgi:pimeloyl-ACP methyl ester carboxylesterase